MGWYVVACGKVVNLRRIARDCLSSVSPDRVSARPRFFPPHGVGVPPLLGWLTQARWCPFTARFQRWLNTGGTVETPVKPAPYPPYPPYLPAQCKSEGYRFESCRGSKHGGFGTPHD